ncbi:MAG TPA: hypothetical protein VFG54_20575 [Prolixibacteraceae bacterium]|nr:hypothetical protein [Prolixibacteraceae bacterium]
MIYVIITIIIIGLILYFLTRGKAKADVDTAAEVKEESPAIASDCCGAHEVCDFDDTDFNEEIILYFEDEDLDKLRNVRESDLTPEQIDELREVLYTLKPNEIGKWLVSLGRRHIHLPAILQQEARQLIAENV